MKRLIILLILVTLTVPGYSQSVFKGFFKPIPDNIFEAKYSLGAMTVVPAKWLIRPQVSITAVQINLKTRETSTFNSAGVGVGYQHYINIEGRPFNNYGFNLLLLLGQEIATEGELPKAAFSIAAVANVLGWINVGPIYDTGNNTFGILTGVSLKF